MVHNKLKLLLIRSYSSCFIFLENAIYRGCIVFNSDWLIQPSHLCRACIAMILKCLLKPSAMRVRVDLSCHLTYLIFRGALK